MFENDKYITNGVKAEIPVAVQNVIWYMIQTMEFEEKDYLQVFRFEGVYKDGKYKQKIIHSQEQPEYKKEHILTFENIIKNKIFVIDDGTHTTMLLAQEY